jgi:DNA-binding NtrC family response regulator
MNKKLNVLIVDDDIMMARTLKDIFTIKGYYTEAVNSGLEALKTLESKSFDFVLSDIKMPDMNGLDLYRAIKDRWPNLPVVLMTAYSSEHLVSNGLKEGVVSVVTKPLEINILLDFLSSFQKDNTIVIIEDDETFYSMMSSILEKNSFKTKAFSDPEGVIEKMSDKPEAFILDMKLNDISGLDVLRKIKEKYSDVPVILMTGYAGEMFSDIEKALELGAITCLYKPFHIMEMIETLRGVQHEKRREVFNSISGKKLFSDKQRSPYETL